MEGKIDKHGFLWIKRKGKFVIQVCPFTQNETKCGHWCPQFGEPTLYEAGLESTNDIIREWFLSICQGKTLVFNKFEDERE